MSFIYGVSILALIILSLPLLILIVILGFIFNGKPILFKQLRVGKDGNIFTIYKFRTMVNDSEKQKMDLIRYNEADGPVFKIKNDPRYTQIGKFLAHTGLDELPQLWNVLKGDMALIGPRPLPVDEAKRLKPWQKKRLGIKPGIISPWILQGYHTMSFDAWMRSDIAYTSEKSFLYDVRLAISVIYLLLRLFIKEIFTLYRKRI